MIEIMMSFFFSQSIKQPIQITWNDYDGHYLLSFVIMMIMANGHEFDIGNLTPKVTKFFGWNEIEKKTPRFIPLFAVLSLCMIFHILIWDNININNNSNVKSTQIYGSHCFWLWSLYTYTKVVLLVEETFIFLIFN